MKPLWAWMGLSPVGSPMMAASARGLPDSRRNRPPAMEDSSSQVAARTSGARSLRPAKAAAALSATGKKPFMSQAPSP